MSPNKKSEILFFLPELGNGGAEMNAVRLAEGLLKFGFQPVYAVARGPGSYTKYLPEGVEVVVLPTKSKRSATLRLLQCRQGLAMLIDERKPDFVCPVMPLPSLALLSAIKRCSHQPKIVLSIQNALKGVVFGNRNPLSRIQSFLIRRMWPRADLIIALSHGVANEIRYLVPDIDERTIVIPNVGMPLENQISAEARQPVMRSSDDIIRFVACGRLNKQKGYCYLLEAFALVTRSRSAVLNILGVGPLRAKLETQAQELGIGNAVNFLGFQDDPLVHMKRADIFVLSSLWEGFGNVIVEAMAMGTPVISTDCPHGPSEIITHKKSGILVPPRNVQELANAMIGLAAAKSERQKYGAAGLEKSNEYRTEVISKQYADALHKLM